MNHDEFMEVMKYGTIVLVCLLTWLMVAGVIGNLSSCLP